MNLDLFHNLIGLWWIFRKSTGQSCLEYVNDLRIGKACNLLLSGQGMNISEIAYRSGFNSQTLFNRCFLKKKKMRPKEFRQLKGRH
ncbi:MAG: helix-turn-helix domain-containing protein [Bacteroidota bacterium]